MSTLIAILLVIVLLLTEHLRRKKEPRPVFARRYLHPGHTWMQQTGDGEIMVGIDDFAGRIVAGAGAVRFPRYLRKLHQGEPSVTLTLNNRTVTFVSPVTGRVIEKNEMVLRDPSLISSSPFRDGWLFKVHPSNLKHDVRNLLAGKWTEYWLEDSRSHLIRLLSMSPFAFSQDGGQITKNIVDLCSETEWRDLTREFFLSDVEQDDKPERGRKESVS